MAKKNVPVSMDKLPIGKGFIGETITELKKVTWPTRQDTVRLTMVVIVISLIIGLYIGIIDVSLAKGIEVLTQ